MKGGLAAIIFALRHLSRLRDSFAGEVVATFAINGERSALVEQFVETCRETLHSLK